MTRTKPERLIGFVVAVCLVSTSAPAQSLPQVPTGSAEPVTQGTPVPAHPATRLQTGANVGSSDPAMQEDAWNNVVVLKPGTRVKAARRDFSVVEGRLIDVVTRSTRTSTDDEVIIRTKGAGDRNVRVLQTEIAQLERRIGGRTKFPFATILGFLGGTILGAIWTDVGSDQPSTADARYSHHLFEGILIGTGIGGLTDVARCLNQRCTTRFEVIYVAPKASRSTISLTPVFSDR